MLTNDAQIGFQALGAFTLRVELNIPLAFFLDLCAFPTPAVLPRQTIEKHGDHWLHARPLPVSGAFQLGAWTPRPIHAVRLCADAGAF